MADYLGSETPGNSTDDYESRADDEYLDAPRLNVRHGPPASTRASSSDTNDFSEVGCFTATSVLPPRMAHNPFAVKVRTPTRSMADSTEHKESRPILAPPTLVLDKCTGEAENSVTSVTSTFRLKAPILNNPFLRVDTAAVAPPQPDNRDISTTDEGLADVGNGLDNDKQFGSLETTMHDDTELVQSANGCVVSTVETHAVNESPPKADSSSFSSAQPICTTSVSTPGNVNINYASTTQEFVFGQNMNERVTNVNNSPFGTANGVNDFTFGAKGPIGKSELRDDVCFEDGAKQLKSLTESALEYESRKVKRTYEEVTIVTGEEDESNVLQMNCKLFAFDKVTSSWAERGRGLLRLNDKEVEGGVIKSRIVARTQGSLRVVLNTKVWAGMSVDRPSPNSVRLTAMDGETVKVFLVKAGPKDCDQLFGALDWRVTTLKSSEERRANDPLFFQMSSAHSCGLLGVATGEETISSSATSPSLSPCSVAATGDITTSVAGEGTKKRRISPPSISENDDSSSCGVQERRVDSTECVDAKVTDSSNHIFATGSPTV